MDTLPLALALGVALNVFCFDTWWKPGSGPRWLLLALPLALPVPVLEVPVLKLVVEVVWACILNGRQ